MSNREENAARSIDPERLQSCIDDVATRPFSHPVATGWYAEDVPVLLARIGAAASICLDPANASRVITRKEILRALNGR